jgi:hypothetical protein
MGLDMYLSARKFVSGSEYASEQDRTAFGSLVSVVNAESVVNGYNGLAPSATVDLSVAYWRKANQIHAWFISNCAGGNDDQRQAYVSREQLTELLELCKQVKEGGKDLAEELLPPSDGFFFGSSEISEWYWQDIDNTIDQLTTALAETSEDWDFIYEASW